MTRKLQSVVFAGLLLGLSAAVFAQDESGRPARQVVNEDRGRAYIITEDTAAPTSNTKRGASASIRQLPVFIGDGWMKPDMQARIAELSTVFPARGAAQRDEAEKSAPSVQSARILPSPKNGPTVNDLSLQAAIRDAIDDDMQTEVERGAILVVYLDPTLHSTLADLESGKHYAAYENTFNFDGVRVRYVVVPLDVNGADAAAVARKAALWASIDL